MAHNATATQQTPASQEPLLSGFRALDLTGEEGLLCGKLLADLGVDVIKVEKPGGDPARRIGPFYQDIPHPERSLFWWAFNANKRSITLDIRTRDGQHLFERLVKTAHFVIESFPPGYLGSLGLGYSTLSQINPQIIVTSITPFGQTGPCTSYQACDLVLMALGGLMSLHGDADRAPVRFSAAQAHVNASAQAAVATVIAHYHRGISGEGQHVDVSAQEAISNLLGFPRFWWDANRTLVRRAGSWRIAYSTTTGNTRVNWPCKDGYVCFLIMGGISGEHTNRALVEWMASEGLAPEYLKSMDFAFDATKMSQEDYDRIAEAIGRFFSTHTKAELYQGAIARGIMLFPVNTIEDIVSDEHLRERGSWQQVEHPELGLSLTYPGDFVRLVGAPSPPRHRAPFIGEHNQEIYCELGLAPTELCSLKEAGII